MAANMKTMRVPVASAQVMRPSAMRAQAFKATSASQLKPAHFLGRSITARVMKAARSGTSRVVVVRAADDKVVVIGLAADSGCGKSTFMRRVTGIFGGVPKPPADGNPDSNTLISEMTTVICLDDYHSLDRNGRKVEQVTALDPKAQNFDLMYQQVRHLCFSRCVFGSPTTHLHMRAHVHMPGCSAPLPRHVCA
jgi:hypothetical protein